MLLTIRTTYRPATDLGFLLHKHPAHARVPVRQRHRLLPRSEGGGLHRGGPADVDPVGMVRGHGKGGAEDVQLGARWPMRAKATSRGVRVAAGSPCWPLFRAAAARASSGALFEPLGYEVEATCHELDESGARPSWLFTVTLGSTRRLSELLTHLYVLVPVLDDQKHYWVGDDEVENRFDMAKGGSTAIRRATRLCRDIWCISEASPATPLPG
jgi:hypothetical protein